MHRKAYGAPLSRRSPSPGPDVHHACRATFIGMSRRFWLMMFCRTSLPVPLFSEFNPVDRIAVDACALDKLEL